MRKLVLAGFTALTLTFVPASTAFAQTDDTVLPDNPVTDETSADDDNFDDWGLLGLLGLLGLAGLAGRKKNHDHDHDVATTRRTTTDDDLGRGGATSR